jgi:RNA polymerase sigma-70 factor, ECF subfamily
MNDVPNTRRTPALSSPLTDDEVVDRVLAGDAAMFEVLMRRHNQRVYRAIRGVMRDEMEIEDTMQQAYLAAFVHLEQFEKASRFSTWLIRIALNEALTRLRRRGRLVAIGDPLSEDGTLAVSDNVVSIDARPSDPERSASARELIAVLEDVIDELPEAQRIAFLLREVEGMSTAEAASCLGLTESALKVRFHRAKAQIRESLIERVGEGAKDAFHFEAPRCDRVVAAVLRRLPRIRG